MLESLFLSSVNVISFLFSSVEHSLLPGMFLHHDRLLWTSFTPSCPSSDNRDPLCFLCHTNHQRGGGQAESSNLQQAHGQHRRGFQSGHRSLPVSHPRSLLFLLLCGEISKENAFCHTGEECGGGAGYSVWWLPQERKESSKPKHNDQLERNGHSVVAVTAESPVCFVQQCRPLHHFLWLSCLSWNLRQQLHQQPPVPTRAVLLKLSPPGWSLGKSDVRAATVCLLSGTDIHINGQQAAG